MKKIIFVTFTALFLAFAAKADTWHTQQSMEPYRLENTETQQTAQTRRSPIRVRRGR